MNLRLKYLFVFFIICSQALAQDHEKEEEFGRHRLAPLMGFTYVFNTTQNSNHVLGSILVPTIGIDYLYKFSPNWGLGWYNDLELSSYLVESGESEEIRRERAFVTALGVSYNITHHFAVFTGYGIELERHQNFQVFKAGMVYGIPFRDAWDLGFGLTYDHKEIYQSLAFSILFERKFKTKR